MEESAKTEIGKNQITQPFMSSQELASSRIRRTPSGKLYARDFESFYAMLIFSLELSETPKKNGFLAKSYPFCFTLAEAEVAMRVMTITVQRDSTITTIVCKIPENRVIDFLNRFMHARLLHCPSVRTQDTITKSILIQPTSKGIFLLGRYCARTGIKNEFVTKLLLSPYNSMRCITLERNTLTDVVLTSGSFTVMIFQRFLGKEPNVYDPSNPPDLIPNNNIHSLYRETSDIEFYHPIDSGMMSKSVSPYFHRYFTHPDSSSITQYYVSYKGVRVFKNKQFTNSVTRRGISSQKHDFVFTGKAIWQWFMECTDLVYAGEAIELPNMFLKSGLIEPILDASSMGTYDCLVVSPEAFYKVSSKGQSYCLWNVFQKNLTTNKAEEVFNSRKGSVASFSFFKRPRSSLGNSEEKALEEILNDAGLRLLFREHLEHNFCQENLLFYTETEQFLLRLETGDTNDSSCIRSLFLLLYSIYNRYLAPKAPFELNLPWDVKNHLVNYLTDSLEREKPLKILQNAAPLLIRVKKIVRQMLCEDSVPKFLQSPEFNSVRRVPSPVLIS